MLTNPVNMMLWRDLEIFLFFGALLGVLLGLLLIFKPKIVDQISGVANRWVSTRHISRWLDRSISIENWFYHHHRAVGIAVVLGAAYIFIYFSMLFDKVKMLQSLRGVFPARLLEGLLNAMVLCSMAGGAIALIVGMFLWLRPSLLRGTEGGTNLWVSSRRATKVLEIPHSEVDRFVARHAQRVGWLLLLGSIYLFFAAFRMLA